MIKKLLLILSQLFLAALAGFIGYYWQLWAVLPVIFIPFIVYHSTQKPLWSTLLWALVLGYFMDRLTLAPTGFHIVLLTWGAALIYFFLSVANMPSKFATCLFSAFLQLFVNIGGCLMLKFSNLSYVFPTTASSIFLPQLAIVALLALILFPFYQFIYKSEPHGYSGLEQRKDVYLGES